jgi:diadenylate cyclase
MLKTVAPGTALREGLDGIISARTGALIVVGDSPEVTALADGGFRLDCELTPARLYELSKMDGAIILSGDARRILLANALLVPDPLIPSGETGTRHKTADRVARQTGELVIAISQKRNVITLYKGSIRYVIPEISVTLARANQALQTLEKYRSVRDQAMESLSALEFEDMVTLADVAVALLRTVMVRCVAREIEKYICELGSEGRLVRMQLAELVANIEDEGDLLVEDYIAKLDVRSLEAARRELCASPQDEILDPGAVARILGYPTGGAGLDTSVSPRGYRTLARIGRIPKSVADNLVTRFKSLQGILEASTEELDQVDGIGAARAQAIKHGLQRLRDQALLDGLRRGS